MAYCPECGAEFGGGMDRCPACEVDLLEELADPNLYDSQDEDLVLVKEAANLNEAQKIKDYLQKNGILSVVEGPTQNQASETMRVLVNQKDQARSQELLKKEI